MWDDDLLDDNHNLLPVVPNNMDVEPAGPELPEFDGNSPHTRKASSLLWWVTGFFMNFKAKYRVPDAALDVVFRFLSALFTVMSLFSPIMALLAKIFPKSVHTAKNVLGLQTSFTKYVVCKRCWKLYSFEDAVNKCGSCETSRSCTYISYPNHPQPSQKS